MPHQCTTCGQTFPDGSKEMLSGCPGCGGNKFQYLPSDILEGGSPPEETTGEEPPSRDDDSGVTDAVGRAATTVRDYVARRSTENERQSTADSPGEPPSPDDSTQPEDTTLSADVTQSADTPPSNDTTPPADTTRPADPTQPDDTTQPADDTASADTTPSADADTGTDAEPLPPSADDEDSAQASARGDVVDQSELPAESKSSSPKPPGEGRVVKEPDETDSVDRPGLDDLRKELNEQFESIRIVAPGQYELNLMELYDREEHIIALQEDGRYVIQVPDSWRDADED